MLCARRLEVGIVVVLCIKALYMKLFEPWAVRTECISRSDPRGLRPILDRLMLLIDELMVLTRPRLTAIAGPAYSSIYRHRGSFNLMGHALPPTIMIPWVNA